MSRPTRRALSVLSGRRAYQFWYRDRTNQARTFAVPTPHVDEVNYFRQIEDLACDLYDQCRVMRDGLTTKPTIEIAVLLAEVTDDLEFRRAEVRRYLDAHSVPVLPERSYPLGGSDFVAALDADLARCRLFVQLLGPIEGKRPPDVPDGYCRVQFARAKHRGVPVLQWRSPELDLAAVESRHREILELPTVQATSLESFKRAITASLVPPPPNAEPRRAVANRPLMIVLASKRRGCGDDSAENRDGCRTRYFRHSEALRYALKRLCQLKQPQRETRSGLTVGKPEDLCTGCTP